MKPVLKKKPIVIDWEKRALNEVEGLQELKTILEQMGCVCNVNACDSVLSPGQLAWAHLNVRYGEKKSLIEWNSIVPVLSGEKTIFPWDEQREYRKDFFCSEIGRILTNERFVVYEITKLDKEKLVFVTELIEQWERPTPGPDFGFD